MKNSAILFLFCIGIAAFTVFRADNAEYQEVVYHATMAADGVLHTKIDGGMILSRASA